MLLDHYAVTVGAVGGVLAARGKRVDLFGVIVLALVTALGGGTVRDWSLGHLPVLWIRDGSYLANGVVSGLGMFFLATRYTLPRRGLLVADAFGLSIGTVAGTVKALSFNTGPVVAVALGIVTGVAGGVIRDVLLGEIPLVFRTETHFYATASLIGASTLVMIHPHTTPESAVIIGGCATLLIRLASLRWKLGLPSLDICDPSDRASKVCGAETGPTSHV